MTLSPPAPDSRRERERLNEKFRIIWSECVSHPPNTITWAPRYVCRQFTSKWFGLDQFKVFEAHSSVGSTENRYRHVACCYFRAFMLDEWLYSLSLSLSLADSWCLCKLIHCEGRKCSVWSYNMWMLILGLIDSMNRTTNPALVQWSEVGIKNTLNFVEEVLFFFFSYNPFIHDGQDYTYEFQAIIHQVLYPLNHG